MTEPNEYKKTKHGYDKEFNNDFKAEMIPLISAWEHKALQWLVVWLVCDKLRYEYSLSPLLAWYVLGGWLIGDYLCSRFVLTRR